VKWARRESLATREIKHREAFEVSQYAERGSKGRLV
jgi:hypothetical protein